MKKVNVTTTICFVMLLVAGGASATTVITANSTGGIYSFNSDLTGMTELATGYGGVQKDMAVGNNSIYFSNGEYLFQCNGGGTIVTNTFASVFNTVAVGPDGYVYTATPFANGGGLYRFNADLTGFTQLFIGYGGEEKDLAVSEDSIYFTTGDVLVQCNLSGGMLGYTFDGNFSTVALGPDGYIYTANPEGGLYRFNADLTGFTQLSIGWGVGAKDLAVTEDSIYFTNGAGSVVQCDLNGALVAYTFDGDFNTVAVGPDFESTLLPGDANRDGVVSAGDYASVQSNFGATGEPGIPGDANLDGVVSAGDYASVQANFGSTGAGVIPEPMTVSLLGMGCAALIRRRK